MSRLEYSNMLTFVKKLYINNSGAIRNECNAALLILFRILFVVTKQNIKEIFDELERNKKCHTTRPSCVAVRVVRNLQNMTPLE